MINLEGKTLTELKELAKENNIKNISKLKKDELIEILEKILPTKNENEIEEKAESKMQYASDKEDGYKLTNEGDQIVEGILEILPDGYGFLRGNNYLSSDKDVYI